MQRTSNNRNSHRSLLVGAACLSVALAALTGCDQSTSRGESAASGQAVAGESDQAGASDYNDSQQGQVADADATANGGTPDGDAPTDGTTSATPDFSAAQLEQMVAPIALYPDALLTEVLMAATYPAEVAEAGAWAKQHPGLNGKELDDAIADQKWDVSVNSLVHATQALEMMTADPAWTKDLGDAFLAQQDDVLNAVQVMRNRACDAGTLKTTEQQEVVFDKAPPRAAPQAGAPPAQYVVEQPQRIVRIVPVQPEVIYVPSYNPTVVFGAPPPVIFYPRVSSFYPVVRIGVAPVISFGVGFAFGGVMWGDVNWNNNHFYSRRYGGGYYGGNDYYRNNYASYAQGWRHDDHHRRGVSYRRPDYGHGYYGGRDYGKASKDYDKSSKDYDKSSKDYGKSSKDYDKSSKDYDKSSKDYGKASKAGKMVAPPRGGGSHSSGKGGKPPSIKGGSSQGGSKAKQSSGKSSSKSKQGGSQNKQSSGKGSKGKGH